MKRSKNGNGLPKPSVIHAASYCRQSVEETHDSGFSSVDAQRESCVAYIAAQKPEGWVCHPESFDDPGFSGASMDRPALRRLLAEVEAGRIQVIVVYRLDRLSRYLPDFVRMHEILDRHGCALVSVSESFSTATPAGRLHLNMLMSFAQHEREVIAQRTSDKMRAARRHGRWIGGYPPLGYDLAEKAGRKRLVVNDAEAPRVKQIYELYLETESLLDTVIELNRRGWKSKQWTTRHDQLRGGHPWAKNLLHSMLTNATFIGKVLFEGTMYEGEHPAILDEETWNKVQRLLKRNAKAGGQVARNKHNALLAGILRCAPCEAAMTPTYTQKKTHRVRYYVCTKAQRFGRSKCPTGALPAGEVERFVIDRIRTVGTDSELRAEVLSKVGKDTDREDLARQLAEFAPVWDTLAPKEQSRLIQLLIERVAYDAEKGTMAVTFRPTPIRTLTEEADV